jgi:hypothetical protein
MNAPAFFVVAAEVARLRRREVGRSPANRYGPRGKYMPVFSALCIFAGDNPQANPDAAAEALRAAGYQVFRLPPAFRDTLYINGDDFVEIRKRDDDDEKDADDLASAIRADTERIVEPFGGDVDCVGAANPLPFIDLFLGQGKTSGTYASWVILSTAEKTLAAVLALDTGIAGIRFKLGVMDKRLVAVEKRIADLEQRMHVPPDA